LPKSNIFIIQPRPISPIATVSPERGCTLQLQHSLADVSIHAFCLVFLSKLCSSKN
jgi:hypothetical protein